MRKLPNIAELNDQLVVNKLPTIEPTGVARFMDDRVDGRMLLGAGIGGMNGVLLSRLFKLRSTGALTLGVLGALLGGYAADRYGVKKTASLWGALGLSSIVPGAFLLKYGLIGANVHRSVKALSAINKLDRVEKKKALAAALHDVRGIPDKTWIATTPGEAARLGVKQSGNTADYWMLPLKFPWGEKAAYVNAPQDAAETLNLSALKHELGHAVDHNKRDLTLPPSSMHRRFDKLIGLVSPKHTHTLDKEVSAWNYSGIPETNKVRRAALGTYTMDARTELLRELADLAIRA